MGAVGHDRQSSHSCAWRAQGKKLVFVTNNSTKSRKGYLGKFTGLGLNVNAEEIYSSSYAAAAYLESIDFPKDKKVCTSSSRPGCLKSLLEICCHSVIWRTCTWLEDVNYPGYVEIVAMVLHCL